MEDTFVLIEKEEVSGMNFPQEDVLVKESEIKILKHDLSRANLLGNLERHKVKIFFADEEGKKKIHTTIWGITDRAILLKKNVVIPINRIYKLEI